MFTTPIHSFIPVQLIMYLLCTKPRSGYQRHINELDDCSALKQQPVWQVRHVQAKEDHNWNWHSHKTLHRVKGVGIIHSGHRMDSSMRLDTHIVAHQTNKMCSRQITQQEKKKKTNRKIRCKTVFKKMSYLSHSCERRWRAFGCVREKNVKMNSTHCVGIERCHLKILGYPEHLGGLVG